MDILAPFRQGFVGTGKVTAKEYEKIDTHDKLKKFKRQVSQMQEEIDTSNVSTISNNMTPSELVLRNRMKNNMKAKGIITQSGMNFKEKMKNSFPMLKSKSEDGFAGGIARATNKTNLFANFKTKGLELQKRGIRMDKEEKMPSVEKMTGKKSSNFGSFLMQRKHDSGSFKEHFLHGHTVKKMVGKTSDSSKMKGLLKMPGMKNPIKGKMNQSLGVKPFGSDKMKELLKMPSMGNPMKGKFNTKVNTGVMSKERLAGFLNMPKHNVAIKTGSVPRLGGFNGDKIKQFVNMPAFKNPVGKSNFSNPLNKMLGGNKLSNGFSNPLNKMLSGNRLPKNIALASPKEQMTLNYGLKSKDLAGTNVPGRVLGNIMSKNKFNTDIFSKNALTPETKKGAEAAEGELTRKLVEGEAGFGFIATEEANKKKKKEEEMLTKVPVMTDLTESAGKALGDAGSQLKTEAKGAYGSLTGRDLDKDVKKVKRGLTAPLPQGTIGREIADAVENVPAPGVVFKKIGTKVGNLGKEIGIALTIKKTPDTPTVPESTDERNVFNVVTEKAKPLAKAIGTGVVSGAKAIGGFVKKDMARRRSEKDEELRLRESPLYKMTEAERSAEEEKLWQPIKSGAITYASDPSSYTYAYNRVKDIKNIRRLKSMRQRVDEARKSEPSKIMVGLSKAAATLGKGAMYVGGQISEERKRLYDLETKKVDAKKESVAKMADLIKSERAAESADKIKEALEKHKMDTMLKFAKDREDNILKYLSNQQKYGYRAYGVPQLQQPVAEPASIELARLSALEMYEPRSRRQSIGLPGEEKLNRFLTTRRMAPLDMEIGGSSQEERLVSELTNLRKRIDFAAKMGDKSLLAKLLERQRVLEAMAAKIEREQQQKELAEMQAQTVVQTTPAAVAPIAPVQPMQPRPSAIPISPSIPLMAGMKIVDRNAVLGPHWYKYEDGQKIIAEGYADRNVMPPLPGNWRFAMYSRPKYKQPKTIVQPTAMSPQQ